MGGDVTGNIDGGDDERVHEWEAGLPNLADLAPLTQGLIPPELLSAFNILPEPFRTSGDVSRASEDTISVLRGDSPKPLDETLEAVDEEEEIDEDDDEAEESDSKKVRRNESPEDADSSAAAKAIKRPRLVWTAQLHERFVDVVAHLGIKNAVPKTIMQLMNVEGLTRENVASHLQKYRLYLKRMQGVSYDPPSNSSEKLFTSSPAPGTSPENVNGNVPVQIPVPYGQPMMPMPIPMPMMGMVMGMGMGNYNGLESNQNHHNQNNNQLNHHHHHHHHNHYHHHHQYNGIMQAGSNKYGSVMTYQQHHPPHVPPGNK